MKTTFHVSGMTCSACQNRVEKAALSVSGVKSATVNLLLESLTVIGNFSHDQVILAVTQAGYEISENDLPYKKNNKQEDKNKKIRTLLFSLIPMAILLFFNYQNLFSVPYALKSIIIASGALLVICIQRKFYIKGFKDLFRLSPTMDSLISLGSAISYLYSFIIMVLSFCGILPEQKHFFFDSSAMILIFISVGKILESFSKEKTTNALDGLISLKPSVALVLDENNQLCEIQSDDIKIGDIIILKEGLSCPLDGIIEEGSVCMNESMLSGESLPLLKEKGREVYCGTICQSGFAKIKVTKSSGQTMLSQIISTVESTSASKAPVERIADKVAAVFVPVIISLSVITFLIWILISHNLDLSVNYAVSVLVISCPCSLGLATPVAVMVGNGLCAKHKILFKDAETLEKCGKTKHAVLDKTGTLTEGNPQVISIQSLSDASEKEIISIAYTLEKHSIHPLAKAISEYALQNNILPMEMDLNSDLVETIPGKGLRAKIGENVYKIGNRSFNLSDENTLLKKQNLNANGQSDSQSLMWISRNDTVLGIIEIRDPVRPESPQLIDTLKRNHITPYLVSGDAKNTVLSVASECHIPSNNVYYECLPQQKTEILNRIKKNANEKHPVILMAGDGINDAPALTYADIGISVYNGTDIAESAANVILLDSNIFSIAKAILISKRTLKTIYQNLFWAMIYNALAIPIAAGILSGASITLTPMIGSFAMSCSSLFVVLNSLRMNYMKIPDKTPIKSDIAYPEERKPNMKQTIHVTGMMCSHCEAHVEKELLTIDGVISAKADHTTNVVEIETEKEIHADVLKATIEKAGYQYQE